MKKHYLACLLCLFFLFALPVQGFAVAGGHGGGSTRSGGSGGSFGGSSVGHHFYDDRPIIGRSRGYYRSSSYGDVEDYILMGASVGGFAAFALFKRKKEERSVTRELFSRIPGKKKAKKRLLSEIETSFFAIQNAWEHEKMEKASRYYTKKLFLEHQQVLQKNQEKGIKNHTKKIVLQQLGNYRQIEEDSFSIRIDFSCYDYTIDRKNNLLLSGYKHQRQYFSQIWYFNYSDKEQKWQVDYIQPISLG
ncbi:hypothetical protein [Enterococcus hirae]|uniref:hypothetical protein n=1 Tax=Enterococcus hirae TaxID=1354 RepID=UPI001A974348|nr:hypothetical protein [Enterococcus hirae]MBO1089276.1 hypothetical protein [Enterococcus hirae]MEB7518286.1 hypothetical protein [Enterococcus hirae]